ncbi:hypothetical protein J8L98_09125 [Pseudoalteromonas sp. MMG013]|nr:hypothetical protein [Pseudoalteromonas sp. MMG013]
MIVIAIFTSLFSGLRIATISHSELLVLAPILPSGHVHFWHMLSACIITLTAISYVFYKNNDITPNKYTYYHTWVNRFGYFSVLGCIITGWSVYFNITQFQTQTLHLISSFLIGCYLLLHSWIYFLQLGKKLIKRVFFIPLKQLPWFLSIGLSLASIGTYHMAQNTHISLNVVPIGANVLMEIDGLADEPIWQEAQSINVHTIGGANFVDGQTTVTIKALSNKHETFFLFTWADPTHSLSHLPIEKVSTGWKVVENGFYEFDEQSHYEDKFAVMLSKTCNSGADGTAHLGKTPFQDKPSNWHGKGYHASVDNKVRDLWHWKAVRTNDMILADDNFIGPPTKVLSGQRRYSAGYLPDGKESGAYVMNWLWYSPNGVIPKRLPKDALYEGDVIPWFGSKPYKKDDDHYPIGTRLPSVLYRSNRFEGDRADVRARGQWKNGQWTLELVRKNMTPSEHDVALEHGTCMWVSAFDHSQIAHTRHNLAISLKYIL